jgi:copper transport protein
MDVTVDPAAVGANTVHIYLTDPRTGAQVDSAKAVDVAAALPGKDIGPIREKAYKSGPGHYTITSLPLGVSGRWDLTVTVRVSDFDQYDKTLEVPVR